MNTKVIRKARLPEWWNMELHSENPATCERCSRSARPRCPECGHSLSANVATLKDNVHGVTKCEVCCAVIEVELYGIV